MVPLLPLLPQKSGEAALRHANQKARERREKGPLAAPPKWRRLSTERAMEEKERGKKERERERRDTAGKKRIGIQAAVAE